MDKLINNREFMAELIDKVLAKLLNKQQVYIEKMLAL